MNVVALAGRLAADPEVRTAGDYKYTRFNVAVRRPGSKEAVDYAEVRVWGPQGENCATYLKKGHWVVVSGMYRRDIFQRPDGSKGTSTYIVGTNVDFGPKIDGSTEAESQPAPAPKQAQAAKPAQATKPAASQPAPQPTQVVDDEPVSVEDDIFGTGDLDPL